MRERITFFLSCKMLYTDSAYSTSVAYLGKRWKSQETRICVMSNKEHSALTRVLVDVLYAAAIFYTQNITWAHRCCPKTRRIKSNAYTYLYRLIDLDLIYEVDFFRAFLFFNEGIPISSFTTGSNFSINLLWLSSLNDVAIACFSIKWIKWMSS